MKCKDCPEYAVCHKQSDLRLKRKTCPKAKEIKTVTNADRIRAMSDEELYKFLLSLTDEGWPFACQNKPECDPVPPYPHLCNDCFKDWLQQPAKED